MTPERKAAERIVVKHTFAGESKARVEADVASIIAEEFAPMKNALTDAAAEIKRLKLSIKDTCDADTEIRTLAKTVMSEHDVDGDSYGVPTIVDIVEGLVREVKVWGEEIALLKPCADDCREFIRKVECGKARSHRSYSAMKEHIAALDAAKEEADGR